ncbi:uncharacterized protein [Ptychodera flava]|uniref:uncharacterized protein n=1 Tax=Ptychodera flava TaxID=63121 RepID=UPI003969C99A
MEPDSDDAIAVVGIACKFPGANDIDEYWRVLVNGENHVTEIPKDRWDNDAFYSSDVNAPGKSYVKSAAFVDRLTEWDNRLFKISDDEAARMDPQQYLLLECTYRALENGGFPLDKLSGTNVGCYVGVMNNDYGGLIGGDVIERNNYTVTGAAVSVIANRLSYTFNLTGPSLCVDTACSSSLIAIHLGSQGIRAGDCYMAICGGVNVILDPNMFVSLCRAGMLSPSGLSQPFSDHADGYARGEGCGVVILKNLKKAIADQDRIWGIIGTGINQDGRFASPITAPSSKQQAELLQRVYCKFNIDPSEVTYIEAHGTGTRLGDPIEASSLGTYIGKARKPGAPNCLIGSVKSNIAHLESAAGVAGLIKVLLMIKNKTIAPTIHFKTPNKQINFHDLKLEVPRKAIEWVEQDSGRLACVNSFGFGGSNAHAIVREYIDTRRNQHLHKPIITISAKSKNAMKYTLQHLRKALKTNKLNIIEDLSYTSTIRRSHHHSYRLACCATSDENLCHLLEKAEKETAEKKAINIVEQKRILFVFPGMGTDWQGMGYDLFENEAIFREAIVQINDLLSEYMDQSLVDAIKKRHLVSGAMRQVAIFAIEVALHHLWSSWGVKPDAIIGHSVGEVAAAYAAGKLSLSAAVKVIFYRSQLLQKVSGGKMLAVSNVSRKRVDELCQAVHKPVEIAAINSNTSFTLSGDEDAIAVIERLVKEQNEKEGSDMFVHRLNVDTAFHSQQIQPICDEFENSIDHLEQPTNGDAIEIYSTVTGKIASDDDYTNKHYWKRNLRQTVQFSKSIEAALVKDKKNIIIEVGPKPALKRYLNELTGSFNHVTLPSMLENKGQATMVKSLCKLYQLGVQIDWNAYHKYDMQIPIDLPMYQFDRNKHWHEPETSLQHRQGSAKATRETYPFVRRVSADAMIYKCHINRSNLPFVYDHIVGGIVVVPGVLYVELALEACYSTLDLQQTRKHYCQLSIEFIRPLELVHEIDIFVRLKQDDAEIPSFSFKIVSGEISHAAGTIIMHDFRKATPLFDISETLGRCVKDIKVQQVYDFLKTFGFSYGPMMQPMTKTLKNGQEAIVLLSLPEELSNQAEGTIVHPVLFDGVLQATGVANFNTVDDDSGYKSSFPVSVGDIEIFGKPNNRVIVYVRKVHSKGYLDIFNAIVLNESGEIVIECKDIFVRVLDEDDTSRVVGKMTYELQWYEIDVPDIHIKDENINNAEKKDLRALNVIFADSLGIASHLPKSITSHSQLLQYSDAKCSAINVHLQNLQRFIKNARHVFYLWGISDWQNKTSSEDVFESLNSVCISLKHIVKFLAQNSATCKLIIVTLGSQSMSMISKEGDYKTEMSLHCGLTGAPLWGMVRSLCEKALTTTQYWLTLVRVQLKKCRLW